MSGKRPTTPESWEDADVPTLLLRRYATAAAWEAMPLSPTLVIPYAHGELSRGQGGASSSPQRSVSTSPPQKAFSPSSSSPFILRDDAIQSIPSDPTLFQIGCIGDGSCFFHALLKAISPTYQNDPSKRIAMATSLRQNLAVMLDRPDPFNPTHTVYASLPQIADLAKAGVVNVEGDDTIAYTLPAIRDRLTDPTKYVGDEIYFLAAKLLSVHLVIFELREGRLSKLDDLNALPGLPIVAIVGSKTHYEVIAAGVPGQGLATFFLPGDPHLARWGVA